MFIQYYDIHLINGDILHVGEDYELHGEKALVTQYRKAADDDVFQIGDAVMGFAYLPKKSIAYITTGNVAHVDRFDEEEAPASLFYKAAKAPNP